MAFVDESQRDRVRGLLDNSLQKIPGNAARAAAELEQACYDAALSFARGSRDRRNRYDEICNGALSALHAPRGKFLETTLAAQVLSGELTAAQAADPGVYEEHSRVDPRHRMRALIYSTLAQDSRFDERKLRSYSIKLERGCYNAAVNHCITSAEAYRRDWDSPMFLAVYSARVGTVLSNADPAGTVSQCIKVGEMALDKLAAGEWPPETLGAMSAAELCPKAGEEARDSVKSRLNKTVDTKTSTLYVCPKCGQRNVDYRQVQIGAGDEAPTIMCTCLECNTNFEG